MLFLVGATAGLLYGACIAVAQYAKHIALGTITGYLRAVRTRAL
jgi:hypothetical protein